MAFPSSSSSSIDWASQTSSTTTTTTNSKSRPSRSSTRRGTSDGGGGGVADLISQERRLVEAAQDRLAQAYAPPTLVGREREQQHLRGFLEDTLSNRKGGAVYLSGAPGTGKTALVYHLLRSQYGPEELKAGFQVLWMDAMNCISGHRNFLAERLRDTYNEAIKSSAIPRATETTSISSLFSVPPPNGQKKMWCVVIDEVDAIFGIRTTSKTMSSSASAGRGVGNGGGARPEFLDNLLEQSFRPGSHLVVIMISNDFRLVDLFLNEAYIKTKRIEFTAYSWQHLVDIARARIQDSERLLVQDRGLEFCAKKVVNDSWADCRRMLEYCRAVLDRHGSKNEAINLRSLRPSSEPNLENSPASGTPIRRPAFQLGAGKLAVDPATLKKSHQPSQQQRERPARIPPPPPPPPPPLPEVKEEVEKDTPDEGPPGKRARVDSLTPASHNKREAKWFDPSTAVVDVLQPRQTRRQQLQQKQQQSVPVVKMEVDEEQSTQLPTTNTTVMSGISGVSTDDGAEQDKENLDPSMATAALNSLKPEDAKKSQMTGCGAISNSVYAPLGIPDAHEAIQLSSPLQFVPRLSIAAKRMLVAAVKMQTHEVVETTLGRWLEYRRQLMYGRNLSVDGDSQRIEVAEQLHHYGLVELGWSKTGIASGSGSARSSALLPRERKGFFATGSKRLLPVHVKITKDDLQWILNKDPSPEVIICKDMLHAPFKGLTTYSFTGGR